MTFPTCRIGKIRVQLTVSLSALLGQSKERYEICKTKSLVKISVLDDQCDLCHGSNNLSRDHLTVLVLGRVKVKSLSHVRLFATPWTVAYHALLSVGFSREEYWSGWPFPSPEDLPNPGIEPGCPALQAELLPSEPPGKSKGKGSYKFHLLFILITLCQILF